MRGGDSNVSGQGGLPCPTFLSGYNNGFHVNILA